MKKYILILLLFVGCGEKEKLSGEYKYKNVEVVTDTLLDTLYINNSDLKLTKRDLYADHDTLRIYKVRYFSPRKESYVVDSKDWHSGSFHFNGEYCYQVYLDSTVYDTICYQRCEVEK